MYFSISTKVSDMVNISFLFVMIKKATSFFVKLRRIHNNASNCVVDFIFQD